MPVTSTRIREILRAARGRRVAVVGDFMLDRHIEGSVRRISPEAPVPIVEIEKERSGLGGAGNVVANLASLGVVPVVIGVTGCDPARDTMLEHLKGFGCDCSGLLEVKSRRTTVKTRVIAEDQHVVRIDRESSEPLTADEIAKLAAHLKKVLHDLDAVVLQDYNKGVLSESLIVEAMQMCQTAVVPVAVDPKFDNFFSYRGAHLFKPNVREVERALGLRLDSEPALFKAADLLRQKLDPDVLMITRGEKGMTVFARDGLHSIPTHARDVHDVSGAGDTVISTYVTCELGGANLVESATVANMAAGVVCGQVGVVPISVDELCDAADAVHSFTGATSSAG